MRKSELIEELNITKDSFDKKVNNGFFKKHSKKRDYYDEIDQENAKFLVMNNRVGISSKNVNDVWKGEIEYEDLISSTIDELQLKLNILNTINIAFHSKGFNVNELWIKTKEMDIDSLTDCDEEFFEEQERQKDRLFYPHIKDTYLKEYYPKTLMKFLPILVIIDPYYLYESLSRIASTYFSNPEYALVQLKKAIERSEGFKNSDIVSEKIAKNGVVNYEIDYERLSVFIELLQPMYAKAHFNYQDSLDEFNKSTKDRKYLLKKNI